MTKVTEGAGRAIATSNVEPVQDTTAPDEGAPTGAPTETSPEPTRSTATVATAADARARVRRDVRVEQQRHLIDRALDAPAGPPAEPVAPSRPRSPYARAFRLDEPTFQELRASAEPDREVAASSRANAIYLPHVQSGAAAAPPATNQFHANADGTFTFRGTSGDDTYVVTNDGSGGIAVQDGAGNVLDTLPAADAAGARIWGANGNDNITIDASVTVEFDVHGGAGNDTIDASAQGRSMTLAGGSGDDVITGGRGADVLLGLSGDDIIDGGSGADQIEGGSGADVLSGEGGNDRIVAGAGDDTVDGGSGHDLILGGDGDDTLRGGRGSDAIYATSGDTVRTGYVDGTGADVADGADDFVVAEDGTANAADLDADDVVANYDPEALDQWLDDPNRQGRLEIEDTEEGFEEMVRADLGVMLGTTQGRDLLDNVIAGVTTTDPLRIESLDEPGGKYFDSTNTAQVGMWTETYGDGSLRTPNPVLFHELVHARQDVNGDGATGWSTWSTGEDSRAREREATGLSYTQDDGAGGVVVEPALAYPNSDNAYRAELGLKERERYGSEPVGVDPDGWSSTDPTP